eukprot:1497391-Rhodomonas_salina.1
MGNRMKEGEDYEDAFALAFIQADKLDEGVNGWVFITLPKGSNEEPDTVFEVLLQLYGIPSSTQALHLTLTKWFKSQGFATAGFEDSIWVREEGGEYEDSLIVSAHINNTLMACESLAMLEKFKAVFLTRFEGTDEGEVSTYLGAELIRDCVNRMITFKQSVYVQKILQTYGAWDKPSVKTQLKAGQCLMKEDSPTFIDPALHRSYCCITGHLSFLVTMTCCDLAFAYAELSKFVQCPGETHLKAAERVLQYLRGTYNLGLTYSAQAPGSTNVLLA